MESIGEPLPSPDIPDWLGWVWRAWHRLHADRPWWGGGMGPMVPGPITWSAVRDWCDFHAYPGDAVAFLDVCCRSMDDEFMAWHAEQRKGSS